MQWAAFTQERGTGGSAVSASTVWAQRGCQVLWAAAAPSHIWRSCSVMALSMCFLVSETRREWSRCAVGLWAYSPPWSQQPGMGPWKAHAAPSALSPQGRAAQGSRWEAGSCRRPLCADPVLPCLPLCSGGSAGQSRVSTAGEGCWDEGERGVMFEVQHWSGKRAAFMFV